MKLKLKLKKEDIIDTGEHSKPTDMEHSIRHYYLLQVKKYLSSCHPRYLLYENERRHFFIDIG